jgi:hypothetical protein
MRIWMAALVMLALAVGLLIGHFFLGASNANFSQKEVRLLTETAVATTWRGTTDCSDAHFRGHGLWAVTCTFPSGSGVGTYYFVFNDHTGRVVDLAPP